MIPAISTRSTWKSPEFLLVVFMLFVLTILVWLILFMTPTSLSIPKGVSLTADQLLDYLKEIMEYRKSILAVIITAFGAWVGAGAAYYFGKENLREAFNGLLAMKEPTPMEILRKKSLRDMPLKAIGWTVKETTKVSEVLKKLQANSDLWFVPVVDKDNRLTDVFHEEIIWKYIAEESSKDGGYAAAIETDVKTALAKINNSGEKPLKQIYIKSSLEKNAAEANELMRQKKVYLTIITDEEGKPLHYITTGDIRSVLLQV